jgi:hypothetical protein
VTHIHGYHPFDVLPIAPRPSKCTEVGPMVCLAPTSMQDGSLAGFIVGHDAPDLPVRCAGAIMVQPLDAKPVWSMTGSLEGGDLTLTPSILCTRDQFHGFVQGGAWVPA